MKKDELKQYFSQSGDVIKALADYADIIQRMAIGIYESQLKGGKLLIAGNGGSCSQAEHFATEMTCTFKQKRRGFCAISLASNPSAITAWSNDFGFDSYFLRQIESIGKTGDILFLISTGGGIYEVSSWNLVYAARTAIKMGIKVYSLVGKTGGELSKVSNEYIIVPSFETSHIQESHIVCIHAICSVLDVLSPGGV